MSEPELDHPRIVRLPVLPETHRESINEFLSALADKIAKSLNDHRVAAMTDKSTRTSGYVLWLRHQLATIEWAAALNNSRRKAGTDGRDRHIGHDPRGTDGADAAIRTGEGS